MRHSVGHGDDPVVYVAIQAVGDDRNPGSERPGWAEQKAPSRTQRARRIQLKSGNISTIIGFFLGPARKSGKLPTWKVRISILILTRTELQGIENESCD